MKTNISGFSYIEVLVATFLIAIVLVPAIEALHSGIQGSTIHYNHAEQHYRLQEKMEEILARPFTELEQEADLAGGSTVIVSSYSDAAGTNDRRLVYIARYDGDNSDADNDPFTDADNGLLWLKVQTEGGSDGIDTLSKQ